jgi:transcriptional regulator with XRE-family HTH domain
MMTIDTRKGLGASVRARREALGYTLDDLARRANLDRVSLERLEAGGCMPPVSTLLTLALHLDAVVWGRPREGSASDVVAMTAFERK